MPVYKCKDCDRTWVDSFSVRRFPKKAIECSHCKKQNAFKVNSINLINGGIKNMYKCNSCDKRTNVIILPKPKITNKEIVAIDKLDVIYKLAEWR